MPTVWILEWMNIEYSSWIDQLMICPLIVYECNSYCNLFNNSSHWRFWQWIFQYNKDVFFSLPFCCCCKAIFMFQCKIIFYSTLPLGLVISAYFFNIKENIPRIWYKYWSFIPYMTWNTLTQRLNSKCLIWFVNQNFKKPCDQSLYCNYIIQNFDN